MRPVNERRRYMVTPSFIGWAHTQNDLCALTSRSRRLCNISVEYLQINYQAFAHAYDLILRVVHVNKLFLVDRQFKLFRVIYQWMIMN